MSASAPGERFVAQFETVCAAAFLATVWLGPLVKEGALFGCSSSVENLSLYVAENVAAGSTSLDALEAQSAKS